MTTSFLLDPIPPFRLDYTSWALRRITKNIVDQWDGKHYTRIFIIDNQLIHVILEQINSQISVLTNIKLTKPIQQQLCTLLETTLGMNYDLKNFYAKALQFPKLNPLVMQFMGLKPPRFPSIFESLVNAISCQQISLEAGLQIQNRLVQYIGLRINDKYAFPRAIDIANCTASHFRKLGYSTHKSETLIRIASAIAENEYIFDHVKNQSNQEIIQFLCDFKGIGRWSAEYALLRGFGKLDVFPGDDIGAQKNLQQVLHLKNKLDYKAISKLTQKWHPYAGMMYFHLLLYKLKAKGMF